MKGTLIFFALIVVGEIQPYRSGLVGSATAPDGTQCVITQSWNGWTFEFYTVRLHTRKPGEGWHWHYIDHEASRWRKCEMAFSADGAELDTVGGDKTRRSFKLTGGTPSQAPRYLPPEMADRP